MAECEKNDASVTCSGVVSLPLINGKIDITKGTPQGLVHVEKPYAGTTCKRLGIEYGKAIVFWDSIGPRGSYRKSYPRLSGIVIRETDYPKLAQALAEKEAKKKRQADGLPVLAALFTLNRRAKRCRDMAQGYYQQRMHGLAGEMKNEKERIYRLKGQVLHWMVQEGKLVGGKYHRFEFGNWAEVLEGEGYRFHRPCPPPPEASDETKTTESIEAKPKDTKEPTLEIAYEVVEKFLTGKTSANVYEWPSKGRSNRRMFELRFDDDDDDLDFEDDDSDVLY